MRMRLREGMSVQGDHGGMVGLSRRKALGVLGATVGGTLLAACGATASTSAAGFTALGPPVSTATANPAAAKTMYAFVKGGHIQMIGFGNNIFGTADQFGFLYRTASGDGTWSVRVVQQQNTSAFAKAGLMVRASVDPAAPFVDMLAVPGGDAEVLEWRDSPGASAGRIPHGPGHPHAPIYLRLSKKGDLFTGSVSSDGSAWYHHFQHKSSAFGSTYLLGLVACSQSSNFSLDVFSHLQGFTPTAYAAVGG